MVHLGYVLGKWKKKCAREVDMSREDVESTVGPSRGGTSLILCNCGSVHWVLTRQASESLALRNGEYVREKKSEKLINDKRTPW